MERLDERAVLSALIGALNPNETITTGIAADQLAAALLGAVDPGVTISNATFTGSAAQNGSFTFTDPKVVGFGQGIILSSGNAADVVGPNMADSTSSTFPPPGEVWGPGDANLTALSGFPTYDASVLEFDFVPTANQVVFNYAFASDEYPEWVNTPFNDVFAFYVNGTNYATVRQVAGDPASPFVPVAVNNINNGNPEFYPDFVPQRPDLFRPNYFNPNGSSAIDLEQDGITTVLTFQAPVNPGVVNHMKLAIADASDGIYDSAVFIQAGSLVSNKNPVADLSISPQSGQAPLAIQAVLEGEDPDGAPLTYTINWGDGNPTTDSLPLNKTAIVPYTYSSPGEYLVTLTVSNGTLSGTSTEDVNVLGTGAALDTIITSKPSNPSNDVTPSFGFSSTVAGSTFEYNLDGAGFIASPSNLTIANPLADGTHTIEVRATDPAGNTDPTPASYTWVIDTTVADTTAPDTAIVGQPAKLSNNGSPTFTFSSTDPEAEFEYSLDGLDWEGCNDVLTLSALTDGEHTILVQSIDASNNADQTPASYTWTVDTVAPHTTITGMPPALSNDKTPIFSFAATEDNVIFTYAIDGSSFVPGKSGLTLPALDDGSHNFEVQATDAAGNVGPIASYPWEIDTAPPAAPAVTLTNDTGSSAVDNVTNNGALTVISESGAAVEFLADGGAAWAPSFAAKEGPNTVLVRQTDAAGNVSDVTSFSFALDTAAPVAPAVALANDTGASSVDGITQDGSVTVTSESGASVEFSTDGGVSWASNFSAKEGPNAVQVRQTDAAGNVSAVATLNFTLDTVQPSAPGIVLTNDTGSSPVDNVTKDGAVSVSGQEADAKVEYSTDGITWAGSFAAKEGSNTIQVRQTDAAGNGSGVTTLTFTLDTMPPALNPTFSSPPPFVVGTQGVTVSPNAADAYGIVSEQAGTVDTSTVGQKSVSCAATDVAGNSASVSVAYSVIPNTATSYQIVNLLAAYVISKQTQTLPVLFQLKGANNQLISDAMAAKFLSGVTITFDGVPMGKVHYHKGLNLFAATLKIGKQAKGMHELAIHIAVNGTEVPTLKIPVKVV